MVPVYSSEDKQKEKTEGCRTVPQGSTFQPGSEREDRSCHQAQLPSSQAHLLTLQEAKLQAGT